MTLGGLKRSLKLQTQPVPSPSPRYCLRFTLWAKEWELPVKARGTMLAQSEGGVPFEFSGEMVFRDGTSASFFCSFQAQVVQSALVSCEKVRGVCQGWWVCQRWWVRDGVEVRDAERG